MVAVNLTINTKEVETYFTKIKGRAGRIPFKTTSRMARRLKRLIVANLDVKTSSWGAGHNTPKPIKRNLHYRKIKNGHRVFFDPYPIEGGDLVFAVEEGTRPHPQPNNRIRYHPRSKPKHFFKNAVRAFEPGVDGDVRRLAEELVK